MSTAGEAFCRRVVEDGLVTEDQCAEAKRVIANQAVPLEPEVVSEVLARLGFYSDKTRLRPCQAPTAEDALNRDQAPDVSPHPAASSVAQRPQASPSSAEKTSPASRIGSLEPHVTLSSELADVASPGGRRSVSPVEREEHPSTKQNRRVVTKTDDGLDSAPAIAALPTQGSEGEAPEMTLYPWKDGGVVIDPRSHLVSQPARSERRWIRDAFPVVLGVLPNVVGVAFFSVLLMAIKLRIDPDSSSRAGNFVVGIIILYMLGSLLEEIVRACCAVRVVCRTPVKETPEAVLQTFAESVCLGLYRRAYDCLTDVGQHQEPVHLARLSDASKKLPTPSFVDLRGFIHYWQEMPGFGFQTDQVTVVNAGKGGWPYAYGEAAAKLTVVVILTVDTPSGKAQEDRIMAEFAAVKRGGRWFLANGFV